MNVSGSVTPPPPLHWAAVKNVLASQGVILHPMPAPPAPGGVPLTVPTIAFRRPAYLNSTVGPAMHGYTSSEILHTVIFHWPMPFGAPKRWSPEDTWRGGWPALACVAASPCHLGVRDIPADPWLLGVPPHHTPSRGSHGPHPRG